MVTTLCEYGEIGRHAGFRYQCESVGVRVPLGVPLYAPVAQLVEHRFEEPSVGGSIPSGGTTINTINWDGGVYVCYF